MEHTAGALVRKALGCAVLPLITGMLAGCGGGAGAAPTATSNLLAAPLQAKAGSMLLVVDAVSPQGLVTGQACDLQDVGTNSTSIVDVAGSTTQGSNTATTIRVAPSSSPCFAASSLSEFSLQLPAGPFAAPVLKATSETSGQSVSLTLASVQGVATLAPTAAPAPIATQVMEVFMERDPTLSPVSSSELLLPAKSQITYFNQGQVLPSLQTLTPYQMGQSQAQSGQSMGLMELTDPTTKLITSTAASDAQQFLAGYESVSGGVAPQSLYMIDEPMWDDNPSPTQAELQTEANSMDQIISIWRSLAPNMKLVTAVQPGNLLQPSVWPIVEPELARMDVVAVDPYMSYAGMYRFLIDAPLRAGVCPNALPGQDASFALSDCFFDRLHQVAPALKFGLIYQAFDGTDFSTWQAGRTASLLENWAGMYQEENKLAQENLLWGVVPFGYTFQSTTETTLQGGIQFMSPDLKSALIADLGQ